MAMFVICGLNSSFSSAEANYWKECQKKSGTDCHSPSILSEYIPTINAVLDGGGSPQIEIVQFKGIGGGASTKIVPKDEDPVVPFNGVKIEVDPSIKNQEVWGFGASITDSCLDNLKKMKKEDRKNLMQQLFTRANGAGFNYLRIPVGSNDYSRGDYSLNDTPRNEPDPDLKQFQGERLREMIDFVKEAKAMNPDIKVIISPWSPPAWMKNTKSLKGGRLKEKYHDAYARYLDKTIETIQKEGVKVDQMTILNEPLIGYAAKKWDYAQTYMPERQQKKFIEKSLIPIAEKRVGEGRDFPKLLLHDHNWDNAAGFLPLLKEKKITPFIGGLATHCYGGSIPEAQDTMARFRPLNVLNTECSSAFPKVKKGPQVLEAEKSVFSYWSHIQGIGSLRAGSSGSLGWNLCLDEKGGPRNNGCMDCRGLVTIDQSKNQKLTFNPEFEAMAFVSRRVQPGARVLSSTYSNHLEIVNVAVRNPDGKIVVLIHNYNEASSKKVSVNVKPCTQPIQVEIPAGSLAAITL